MYTPKTFYEEYINLEMFCYLRRCGDIAVQSFGSHIRPQPPGLGLSKYSLTNILNSYPLNFQLIIADKYLSQ